MDVMIPFPRVSSFMSVSVFTPSGEPVPPSLCIIAPVVRGTEINWSVKDYGKINNKQNIFGKNRSF